MYKRGDLVWAKMKGFPPWPGIVVAPPDGLKKQPAKKSMLYHCIFFFGSKNYSWIETHKLERYKKGSGTIGGKRSAGLREAITAIDGYIDNGEGSEDFDITPEVDVFDKLLSESKAAVDRHSSPSPDKKKFKLSDESDSDDLGNLSDSSNSTVVVSTSVVNLNKKSTDSVEKANTDVDRDVLSPPKIMNKDILQDKEETVDKELTKDVPSCSKDTAIVDNDDKDKSIENESDENKNIVNNNDMQSSKENMDESDEKEKTISDEENEDITSTHLITKESFVNLGERVPSDYWKYSSFKSPEVKSKVSNNSEHKKKQYQQVVKARPFMHLPKVRLAERRRKGSTTPESTTRKRNSESSGTPSSEGKSKAKRKKRESFTNTETTNCSETSDANYVCRGPAALLLDRPPNISRPDTPRLDLFTVSQALLDKHITPSTLRFGFLGLGIMGTAMVKNLLYSGHRVIVWNRTPDKCREFAKVGAEMALTPQDVCTAADVIFSCVAGPKAAKDMVFGNCGALREMNSSKAYIEMTNIDTETSLDINEAIISRGARYLEAQIQGSMAEAEEGKLVLLCAGDRSLFEECHSCFEAIANASFYFGDVGNAIKMNLVIQMLCASVLAGLAEGMALLDRFGLIQSDLLEVIKLTSLNSNLIMDKGNFMKNCSFPTNLSLSHMQRDIRLGIRCAEDIGMPTPVFSAVNEVYKQTKRMGYGDHDVSSVYLRSRY